MALTIKVLRYQGSACAEHRKAVFERNGFTIGRAADKPANHLCLPDTERFISREHASISLRDGTYQLTDTSVDGTYILNRNRRVSQETISLTDGDLLRIGDYELGVRISSPRDSEAMPREELFPNHNEEVFFWGSDPDPLQERPFSDAGSPDDSQSGDNYHSWWPDGEASEKRSQSPTTDGMADASPLHDAFTPPEVTDDIDSPQGIPNDFNIQELFGDLDTPTEKPNAVDDGAGLPRPENDDSDLVQKGASRSHAAERQAGERLPASEVPPGPVSSVEEERIRRQTENELIRTLLDAAGIKDNDGIQNEVPSDLMKKIGSMFKELVGGLAILLKGRSQLKSQFHVPVTAIRPADNNPLKFHGDVGESLVQLLIGRQPGFIDGCDAVREGYADVINHQLALTAGIQAAIIHLIERFDPERILQHRSDGIVFQKKAKSWDAYCQSYADIASEALEDFFGEVFIRAYEAQVERLKTKATPSQGGRGKEDVDEE